MGDDEIRNAINEAKRKILSIVSGKVSTQDVREIESILEEVIRKTHRKVL